jgi:periplasmic protein TonB
LTDSRRRLLDLALRRGGSGSLAILLHAVLIMLFLWLIADRTKPELQDGLDIQLAQPVKAPPRSPDPKPAQEKTPKPAAPQNVSHPPSPRKIVAAPQSTPPMQMPTQTESHAASAPSPAPRQPDDSALSDSWIARVLGRLESLKRYPYRAKYDRQQGIVQLKLRIDRSGKVFSAAVAGSSGFPLLDQEALDLAARASPLPAPPDDVPGQSIELEVPIQFTLH